MAQYHHSATLPDGANSLGGVLLPVGVRWIDNQQYSHVGQSQQYALGGKLYIDENYRAGRSITLDIRRPYCWLYESKLDSLRALEAVIGAQYALVWRTASYAVRFDRSSGLALDFAHIERGPQDLGLYEGQIRLIATS